MSWARLCRPKKEGGMGFRDLASFNLALLTKQAWRIFHNPELLLSRIMKARYFPRSSFLLADLGERPSQTRRSILGARPYLEMGLRRRIGNGLTSAIWGDAWLVSEGSGKIITSRHPNSVFPDMVRDLINWDRGEWNLEVIRDHMWTCDMDRILKVPLDRYYWFYSEHGKFTVRSCYYQILVRASERDNSPSGTSHALSQKEWQWVWGLHLPPKIRAFLWRACSEILPVRANLVRRGVGGDPFCPLCVTQIETNDHPFFECGMMSWIWSQEPFSIALPMERWSFSKWLNFLRLRLG